MDLGCVEGEGEICEEGEEEEGWAEFGVGLGEGGQGGGGEDVEERKEGVDEADFFVGD